VTTFSDHFSGHASDYAKYRPNYPAELFRWLADISPSTGLAWDCACGNGQAAVALAQYFDLVIATDASANQISNASPADNVDYRVGVAEQSGLEANSVDLITVAQALHWFDLDAFFREAKRVLQPGGILAVWSYGLTSVDPEIDAIVQHLYDDLVGPYWPTERRLVETGYADIAFPFHPIAAEEFSMQADWTLDELAGYLRTWSAVKRYVADKDSDPVLEVEPALNNAWGERQSRKAIRWPLNLRVSRSD